MTSFPDQSHVNCIRDALWTRSTGGASLMVGSGFSKNAEKSRPDAPEIPVWADLATSMYEALYPAHTGGLSPTTPEAWLQPGAILRLAQEYETAFGEQNLYKLIDRQISDDYFAPGEMHARLLRLPWQDVFTTNWDTLLERTRPAIIPRAYGLVRTISEIPLSPRPRIIKLHGCLSIPSRLIFTEEDYRIYPVEYAPFVNTVQQSMMETVFCLIGFSGEDPNFLHWSGWVRDNLGQTAPKIYLAGWLELSPHRRRMLENRNVIPIDLAQHPRANEWPDGLKHPYATDWLLSTLEFGKPYDISDWPIVSTKAIFVPPTHLEPIQRLVSPMPKTEDMPTRDSDGKTIKTLNHIEAILKVWEHNRELYPGWLVIPFRRLQHLSLNTEEWHDAIISALPEMTPLARLTAISELIWRKSTLMEPLFEQIETAASGVLNAIDIRTNTVVRGSDENPDWWKVRLAWLTTAAALVTEGRFHLDRSQYEEWVNKLSDFRLEHPEIDQRLHHEACLWAAAGFDYEGLRQALENWSTAGQDPAWMMRKSALLFEAGMHDKAEQLINSAITTIRENAASDHGLANSSREGWALWSVLNRDELFFNPADAVRKWEELAILKCNANAEKQHYSDALREKAESTDGRPFDLGVIRGETISFSNTGYYRYMAAYRAIRLTELAGLPPAQGGVAVASDILGLAAVALSPHEPEVSCRLILRVATYDKDKQLNSILSRSRVAAMPEASAQALSKDLFSAIEFILPRGAPAVSGNLIVSWYERLRVAFEALSRLVIRLDQEMAANIFQNALEWYATPAIARHPWMSDPIRHLLSRSWEAMPKERRTEHVLDLLSSPIDGMENFSSSGANYPDPCHLLLFDTADVNRYPKEENRWQDVIRLLERGLQQGEEARKRASLRMSWISHRGVLTEQEQQRAAVAFWGPDYSSHNSLPQGTAFYDWVYFTLPQPEPGLAETRFRRKWLDADKTGKEVGDENSDILWQVGMAIRGLKSKDRLLELSEEDRNYLTSVVVAWAEIPVPPPIGYPETRARPLIVGQEVLLRAIAGLKAVLLDVQLLQSEAAGLFRKIKRLEKLGIAVRHLAVGLTKVLPDQRQDIVQWMRMGMASDDPRVAADAIRGLSYWLEISQDTQYLISSPAVDLIQEIGRNYCYSKKSRTFSGTRSSEVDIC